MKGNEVVLIITSITKGHGTMIIVSFYCIKSFGTSVL